MVYSETNKNEQINNNILLAFIFYSPPLYECVVCVAINKQSNNCVLDVDAQAYDNTLYLFNELYAGWLCIHNEFYIKKNI